MGITLTPNSPMKVGIIQQHNTTDIPDNRLRLADKIKMLAAEGARLVVLQELHDSQYFCQTENVDNFDIAVSIPSATTEFYSDVARQCDIVLVTSLFEARQRFSNSAGSTVETAAGSILSNVSMPFIRRSRPFSAACSASFEKSSVER